MQLQRNK